MCILLTFVVANKAGLNIGIAQAIWQINPFFCSLVEMVVYGVPFPFKQLYGMTSLVLCAVCVSLSEVFESAPEQSTQVAQEEKTPMWVAVLCAFVMPVVCATMIVVIKHNNETLKNSAIDWTIYYWGIVALVYQICGIVAFTTDATDFDFSLFLQGLFGSLFNLAGCVFIISCFATGAPIGPACALVCTQTVVLVVFTAIKELEMPSALQFIGLLLGILGALQLTIPDELYALWFRLTRCRTY